MNPLDSLKETVVPDPVFLLAGVATIEHLNVRKEGPDDDRRLAVDLKLSVPGVGGMFAWYFDVMLPTLFWLPDGAMAVRNPLMEAVRFANEIGCSADLDGFVFASANVKRVTLAPTDGGVMTVTCSVTVYPTASQVASLAKRVQDEIRVRIEGHPDLFRDPAGPSDGAAPGPQDGPTAAPGAGQAMGAP